MPLLTGLYTATMDHLYSSNYNHLVTGGADGNCCIDEFVCYFLEQTNSSLFSLSINKLDIAIYIHFFFFSF